MKTVKGDIRFAGSGIIIQGCNAQGVMASGVARDIRMKWPEVYEDYKKAERATGLILGKMASITEVSPGLFVANCITQRYYGRDGKRYASYDAIYDSVTECIKHSLGMDEITDQFHLPTIGCGLGGCDWEIVQHMLAVIEKKNGVNFTIWEK